MRHVENGSVDGVQQALVNLQRCAESRRGAAHGSADILEPLGGDADWAQAEAGVHSIVSVNDGGIGGGDELGYGTARQDTWEGRASFERGGSHTHERGDESVAGRRFPLRPLGESAQGPGESRAN